MNKSNMELDLDSFLVSDSDSDSEPDSDPSSIPHRTVDEILNASSSSSPSSSPPPSSPPLAREQLNRHAAAARPQSEFFHRGLLTDPARRNPAPTTSLRQLPLPSLFAGVRSNVKPGAALAAAVAASRLVPTPHAAIIKSRRASSSASSELLLGGPGEEEDHEVLSSNGDSVSVDKDKDEDDAVVVASQDNEAKVMEVQASDIVDYDKNSKPDLVVTASSSGGVVDVVQDAGDETMFVASSLESLHLNDSDDVKVSNDEESSVEDVKNEDSDVILPDSKEEEEGGDDDGSSELSGISELVEERIEELEKERMSKMEKLKSRSFRKQLVLAEEFEKKQAYTGLHWEEGAAAQPMRLEGVKIGSTNLGYFDVDASNIISRTISSQAFKRDHGSPQVLAVHFNFIAVGMSKGVIVVVPSKYSPNTADQMESKMIWLGLQGERSQSPVTSVCFNQQGALLLAGYGDGHVTVWDVQRASAAKVITEHTAPVVYAFFLGRDSQGSRIFKIITSDTKGVVFKHTFSWTLLLNMYTVKTQCLLDGQKKWNGPLGITSA